MNKKNKSKQTRTTSHKQTKTKTPTITNQPTKTKHQGHIGCVWVKYFSYWHQKRCLDKWRIERFHFDITLTCYGKETNEINLHLVYNTVLNFILNVNSQLITLCSTSSVCLLNNLQPRIIHLHTSWYKRVYFQAN